MFAITTIKTTSFELQDVVDVAALQRIQDTFAKAMSVAAVIVDRQGMPITRESNFCRTCRMIRSTQAGLARCMASDAEGGLGARERGEPYAYVCPGGMLDIAAPITIQGEYLGSVLCGQVVPADAREEFLQGILERNARLNLPLNDLKQAVQEVPSVARERVDAAGEMLFQMANHIVEMGVANLTQSRLLEEIRERAALQSALQDAQLRMLQSQIAPHFLFNALGLIGYTAMQENAHQTEQIAYSLSDLLRYSLRSSTSALVKLRQELEIIQHYLNVQKLRFRSRLNVQVDVDPALGETLIPCMILQPLVENAVVHAVEPLARPVTVQIRAYRQPGAIVLEVADDGVGMSPDIRDLVLSEAPPTDGKHTAVGLRSVIQRLRLQYGNRFDFEIESQVGHGTRVIVTLPTDKRRVY